MDLFQQIRLLTSKSQEHLEKNTNFKYYLTNCCQCLTKRCNPSQKLFSLQTFSFILFYTHNGALTHTKTVSGRSGGWWLSSHSPPLVYILHINIYIILQPHVLTRHTYTAIFYCLLHQILFILLILTWILLCACLTLSICCLRFVCLSTL